MRIAFCVLPIIACGASRPHVPIPFTGSQSPRQIDTTPLTVQTIEECRATNGLAGALLSKRFLISSPSLGSLVSQNEMPGSRLGLHNWTRESMLTGTAMFRIGYAQITPVFGDVNANLAQCEAALEGQQADLLVLPELVLTGYQFRDRGELAELEALCRAPTVGERLTALAASIGGHLVVGLPCARDGEIYNAAQLISPHGVVGTYEKTHLFWDEKDLFAPGRSGFHVWNVGAVRVGVMICFDWVFPEAARSLALAGAEVIAHPSNLVLHYCQRVMPARCVENRVFAVTANRCGTENRLAEPVTFSGRSEIYAPDGGVLASADRDGDAVACVEIDVARARDKWITPRNHVLDDRRPELYQR